ncbi:J domain-containing protein [Hymenobacter tibetensis]|uniref:J domain-containing protein n=1 Tax=Hymenobacter tibetensis TaxID=497967 RepID=A0ABY4CW49_9BACT|nr:J domain-containing protein [Hymenobacter tibetensis]UOG74494.1 J domain-containing protein [Hymenobacter tibetensis]
MKTHYAILGISEQASPNDIRRAYRRLVLLTHPDRTPDPDAHQRFLAVNEAYEALNDPSRRYFYDTQLRELRTRVRPVPVPAPPPTRASRRPPPPPIWRRRYVPQKLDFATYARVARQWGRCLLVLPLVILLDYFVLRHYVIADFARFGTSRDGAGQLYNWIATSHGEFNTTAAVPLATIVFRLKTSVLFQFVHEAYLLDGTALPVHPVFSSLLVFAFLLLLLAGATQLSRISDATRVNVAIVATVVGVIVLLMALTQVQLHFLH